MLKTRFFSKNQKTSSVDSVILTTEESQASMDTSPWKITEMAEKG
jgi:hypothetical protein